MSETNTNHAKQPKRDVSDLTAIGQCGHCGGNAQSTLGGEHIWKCSEIVPNEAIAEIIDVWRENAEMDAANGLYDAADRWDQAANELQTLIDEYERAELDTDQ